MNQRERILAILVGGLAVIGAGQWGFNKYKTKLDQKKTRYESLQSQQVALSEKLTMGALADRQMGEYLVRSLSSDVETARAAYQSWLFEVVNEHHIAGPKVTGNRVTPVGDLFQYLIFDVTGRAEMPDLIALIHEIQAKDYLHRIRDFDIKPAKNESGFTISMTIEVASLNSAPAEAQAPSQHSWRVDPDLVAYTEPILNRNLFEPPNKPPVYDGQETLEATRGRDERITLVFKDPDQHGLKFNLLSPPENVSIDEGSGTLRVFSDELTEMDVTVQVTDSGYPRRTIEQTLVVKIVDPPPPPPREEPKVELAFDDAKQTYLTGLVQGANDWTAWMNVRTRGKTLHLRVGDEFEIGSVHGTIESISADEVQIRVGEKVFAMTSDSTLKAAHEAAAGEQPENGQPPSVQPASVQPASVQPASVQPTSVQPASEPPASVQPASVQPANVQPASAAEGSDPSNGPSPDSEASDSEASDSEQGER